MGGFLLIKKSKNINIEEVENKYKNSIEVFRKKGLSINKKIITDKFVIYVFHKNQFKVENVIIFDKNNFIVSTGTLIYNRKIGRKALKELYTDFSEKGDFLSNVYGHYCLIVSKEDKVYILNDCVGVYHVYTNKSASIISSSFLAVLKTLKQRTISTQEFYEYVINGAFYGDKTVLKEINLINSSYILKLHPHPSKIHKILKIKERDKSLFKEKIRGISVTLIDYFSILKENFKNSISSSLTGGFDSRLILCLMRRVGIMPRLYVYGKKSSSDVKIAKLIAKNENLKIKHTDKSKFSKIEKKGFLKLLEKQYYFNDGTGIEGIFDNGSDMYTQINRTKKIKLHLNGVGGEILRTYLNLPYRRFNIKKVLELNYAPIEDDMFTNYFNKESYFLELSKKTKVALNIESDIIDRQQVEKIYPYLRSKYWAGISNSIENQISYSLYPYTEKRLVLKSLSIPVKFKRTGVFEAALIKLINQDIAKVPSKYGFNFYDGVSLFAKIKEIIRVNTPLFIRPYIKKYILKDNVKFPYYLEKEYLNEIFPNPFLKIDKYINRKKIKNPAILSRVLSVELLITDRF